MTWNWRGSFPLVFEGGRGLLAARSTGAWRTAKLPAIMMALTASFLFASLIWGSVGLGYFIFGKKQQSFIPMIAGLVMMAVSYFVASALVMSLICIAVIAAVYLLVKQGY